MSFSPDLLLLLDVPFYFSILGVSFVICHLRIVFFSSISIYMWSSLCPEIDLDVALLTLGVSPLVFKFSFCFFFPLINIFE